MNFTNQFADLAIIARQKLTGLGEHCGVQLSDGHVLHTTSTSGVQLVTYEKFAAGKPVRQVRPIPLAEQPNVQRRMLEELASRKPYHPLENNCETLANRVAGFEPSSPQAQFWVVTALLAGFLFLANR